MTGWRLRRGCACALGLLLLTSFAAAAGQRLVHSEKSLYREVFVYEDGNTRCLCFTRLCAIGRQTCVDLRHPNRLVFEYTQMMLGALYLTPDPHSILIIGLGGGTLPRTLERLLPNADIDVVEIDPAVVGVAQQYFGQMNAYYVGQTAQAFLPISHRRVGSVNSNAVTTAGPIFTAPNHNS